MLRYLLAWGKDAPAILIVCGDVEPIMRAVITQYVEAWRTGLRLPVTAWFAREEEIGQVDDKVHTREALVAK
jgi:hypothetical protein